MSARQQFQAYLVVDPLEFDKIPSYVSHIDPSKEVLMDVLGHHHFKRYAKCSLKPCRQNYMDGFLVLWRSGAISNIGHCCAEKYVGKDLWAARLNSYRRDVALPHLRADVNNQRLRSAPMRLQLRELHPTVIEYSRLKRAFKEKFPALFELLNQPGIGGSFKVTEDTELKVPILDDEDQPTGRYRLEYKTSLIATIQGVDCLRERVLNLVSSERQYEVLDRLDSVALSLASYEKLVDLKASVDDLQANIEQMSRWVSAARRFFCAESEASIRKLRGSDSLRSMAKSYSLAKLTIDAAVPPKNEANRPLNSKERSNKIYRG